MTTSQLEGRNKRQMCERGGSSTRVGGCLLRRGGTATEGGSSMSAQAPADGRQRDNQPNERGTTIGGASGQEAMQQPAE
jgi:hypothetical protein